MELDEVQEPATDRVGWSWVELGEVWDEVGKG